MLFKLKHVIFLISFMSSTKLDLIFESIEINILIIAHHSHKQHMLYVRNICNRFFTCQFCRRLGHHKYDARDNAISSYHIPRMRLSDESDIMDKWEFNMQSTRATLFRRITPHRTNMLFVCASFGGWKVHVYMCIEL